MKNGHLAKFLGALLLVIVILTLTSGHNPHRVLGEEVGPIPPTAPLVLSADASDQGVTISWQASQNGSFSVQAYQIYRENADGQFDQIAQVDSNITQYVDNGGKDGDTYKLLSLDDQQPADTSAYSDEVSAVAPVASQTPTPAVSATPSSTDTLPEPQVSSDFQPSDLPSNVTPADTTVNNLQDLTKNTQAITISPSQGLDINKVEQIQKTTNIQVAQLQTVIAKSQDNLIQPVLSQYTYGIKQLYQNFNKLPPAQKATTAQTCDQQVNDLETSLSALTDQYQMNVLIALAQCHLIHKQL